jgi:GxxExxY protein
MASPNRCYEPLAQIPQELRRRALVPLPCKEKVVFKQEAYDFMAAAFEVYNEIGYGMAEEIYQQSLEIELSLRQITFLTKQELEVHYKGHKLTTCYKPDLIAFGGIVVELKAVTELLPEHEAQLFNYMRVSRMAVGYLVNFGYKGNLQWKRFILSDLHKAPGR